MFSTKMKNDGQPIHEILNFQKIVVFLFSTEIWAEQLKKTTLYRHAAQPKLALTSTSNQPAGVERYVEV